MQNQLLQDWIRVSGSTSAAYIQESSGWLGLSSFQDAVFWLEIRKLTPPLATALAFTIETSPTKDETLFQQMVSFSATGPTAVRDPKVLPVLLVNPPLGVALATWVRWKIVPAASGSWDTCFRIFVSASKVSRGLSGVALRPMWR